MEEQPRDEARRPVVRPEDLSEWLNKKEIPEDGMKVVINDVFGGETQYGFRYRICTSKGDVTLNKTSLKKIVAAYGTSTSGWVDKPVKITKQEMTVKGEVKDVLMVEPA